MLTTNVQSPKLKGNENNSDPIFQEPMVSNYDETSSIVTQSRCADSIHSQVKSSAEILQNKTHCSRMHNSFHVLIDHCDDLHANKLHHIKLITQAELFAKISPTECLCYTMLDKPVVINEMLENISMITSMRSLNNAHSCKFTFNLIVEHVVDKLLVCAMCITCDNLVDFKLNMLNNNSCEPYFSDVEMNKLFNACCSEPLFPFPYFSLKEGDHAESSAISAPKMFSSTSRSNEFGRYTSKRLNKSHNKKFCDIRNAPSLNF